MDSGKRFFDRGEFNENLPGEVAVAINVYSSFKSSGLTGNTLLTFDYTFISDKKGKLESLKEKLRSVYGYSIESVGRERKFLLFGKEWVLEGAAAKIPVDETNLICWVLDMYRLGFEFDCKFKSWGALHNPGEPEILELKKEDADTYFEEAMSCFERNNLSGAAINWGNVIKVNPKDVDAFYSLAIVKNQLFMNDSAMKDYNRAIEIAPDHVLALMNRGALKDDMGDYDGALEDYNAALKLEPDSADIYFNRGNTKVHLGDNDGAIADWQKAKELGADGVVERLQIFRVHGF